MSSAHGDRKLEVDGSTLETIAQAAYVLRCFDVKGGLNQNELARLLNGENEMTRAYLIYFGEMHWLKKAQSGEKWHLTDEGRKILDILTRQE